MTGTGLLLLFAVASAAPTDEISRIGGEGPIDFRCDGMQVFTKPNRVVCRDNVVVRRGDLLVCCSVFEGYADTKGGWERFICSKNVRAQRREEVMWSEKATFILAISDLILTGRPMIQRGKTLLKGERIVIDTKHDLARIEQPRGRMEAANATIKNNRPPPESVPEGPLPARCPIPRRPKLSP